MATAAQLDVVLGGDNSGAVNAIEGTNRSLAAAGVAVTVWGAAGVAAVKSWTSGAIALEQTWANTAAVTGQSTQQVIDAYTGMSADLAVQFGKTQQDIANGIYDIAQAGDYTVQQTNQIIRAATEGAAAGLTTVAVATDGLTTVLNGYRNGVSGTALDVADLNRINDVMFKTVAAGKISYEELNSQWGDTVPLASQLGVSIEELGAGYASMTSQGISASEASTQLSSIMSGLLKPSTALTDALAAQGYESGLALVQQEGLAGALQFVSEATGGQSDALAELFPNIRATRGLTALLNGDFGEFLALMDGATEVIDPVTGEIIKLGATQEALNRITNTTGFQLERLKSSIGVLGNQIGATLLPFVALAATALTGLVGVFIGLPEPIKQFIGALTGISSAGFLVVGALIAAKALFAGLGITIATVIAPILAVAAGLALLSVAWTRNWGGIRTATNRAASYLQTQFRALGVWLRTFAQVFDIVAKASNPLAAAFYTLSQLTDDLAGRFPFLERPLSALSDAFRIGFEVVKQAGQEYDRFREHMNPLAAGLQALGTAILGNASAFGVLEGVARNVGVALQQFGKAATDVGDVLQALWERDWDEAAEEARTAIQHIINGFDALGSAANKAWDILSDAFASINWGALWDTVADSISGAVSTVTDRLKAIDWASQIGDGLSFDFGHAVGERIATSINALTFDDLLNVQALMNKVQQGLIKAIGGGIALAGVGGSQLNSAMTGLLMGIVEGINWGQVQTTLTTRWREVLMLFATSFGGIQAQIGKVVQEWLIDQFGTIDWAGIGNNLKQRLSDAINSITLGVESLSGMAQNVIGAITLSIYNKLTAGADFGTVILQGIREKINSLALSAAAFPDFAKSIGEGIANAIKTQVESWSGDTVKSAITRKINSLSAAAGDFASFAVSIGEGVANAIKNQVDSWSGDTVKSAITSKINGLTVAAGDVAGFASSIASAIWDAVKAEAASWDPRDLIPNFKKVRDFSDDANAAKQAAGGKNDFSALISGASDVVASLRQLATEATTAMTTVATAISTAATNSTTSLTNLGVAVATAQTFISTAMTAITTAVQTAMTNITTAVQTAVTTITTALTNLGVAFATAQTFVATMMTQMTTAIVTAMVQSGVAVTTGTTVMTSTLNAFATSAGTAGTKAGDDFSTGVSSGMNVAVRAAQRGSIDIQAAMDIPSQYDAGYSVGSSLGEGIAAGLLSQLANVQNASAALTSAASAGAQARGEIRSPSRLMARTVGVPLAQGIVAGMASQRGFVSNAFASLIPLGLGVRRNTETLFSGSNSARTARNLAQTGGNTIYNVAMTGDDLLALLRKAERGASLADGIGTASRTSLAGVGVRMGT